MPEEFDQQNDDELRRSIRAEIEQRDREQARWRQEQVQARNAGVRSERRRQIYQQELRRYYAQKPGYHEIVREDGESDWIPEGEFRKGESLIEEAIADPAVVRQRLKWFLLVGLAGVVALAGVFFFVLAAKSGSIMISANVADAQIILDTVPLQLFTNAIVEEVPEGEHVVTVQKAGYEVVGDPVQRIAVRGGKTISLTFLLRPQGEASQFKPANPEGNPVKP